MTGAEAGDGPPRPGLIAGVPTTAVLADRGYDSDAHRLAVRAGGPSRASRRGGIGRRRSGTTGTCTRGGRTYGDRITTCVENLVFRCKAIASDCVESQPTKVRNHRAAANAGSHRRPSRTTAWAITRSRRATATRTQGHEAVGRAGAQLREVGHQGPAGDRADPRDRPEEVVPVPPPRGRPDGRGQFPVGGRDPVVEPGQVVGDPGPDGRRGVGPQAVGLHHPHVLELAAAARRAAKASRPGSGAAAGAGRCGRRTRPGRRRRPGRSWRAGRSPGRSPGPAGG